MLGRSVIPSCWLFGTRCPALESAGSCVEPGLGVNVGTSGRTHADYYSLGPGILWWSNILDLTHLPRLDSWSGNQEAHKLFSMKEKKEKRKRKQRQAKPKTNDKLVIKHIFFNCFTMLYWLLPYNNLNQP